MARSWPFETDIVVTQEEWADLERILGDGGFYCQGDRWLCWECNEYVPDDEIGFSYKLGYARCFVCRAAGVW